MKFNEVTTVVFGLVALGHIGRVVMGWDLLVGGWTVPSWLSILVGIFAIALSWWGWKS